MSAGAEQPLSDAERAELEDLRAFWRGAGRKLVEESIPALEASAQHVVTAIGLLVGLYTGALSLGDLGGPEVQVQVTQGGDQSMSPARLFLYLLPVLCWLAALVAAMLVFWRATYHLNLRDAVQLRDQIHAITRRKQTLVLAAMALVALGIGAVVFVLADYLGRL